MDPKQQQELFRRYLQGTTTIEENAMVEQWYASFDGLEGKVDETDFPLAIGEKIYTGIKAQTRGGKQIQLWSLVGKVAAVLLLSLLGSWYFFRDTNTTAANTTYTYFRTSQGEHLKVFLPDSTLVSLNESTTLKYAKGKYGENKREVWLETGEAFFEVKRNERLPFVAYTGPIQTKVLGTAFNIKRSSQFQDIQVSVAHGKVQVSSTKALLGYLTKGKQISYQLLNGQCTFSDIDPEYSVAWNKPIVELSRASFKELSAALYSLYNIKIKAGRQEIQNYRYTLTLDKSLSGKMALEIITAIHQLNQREANGHVVLY